MVKIAIAGATSQLAREVIDQLSAVGKHEIVGLIRKDKDELVNLLKGVHTVLSFVVAHLDPGSDTQKRIIDASVEAGVKRFAPSEWAVGEKLDTNYDVTPWYAGKVEVANYLKQINKSEKVIEYCRFQPGAFLDMLTHPHPLSKHVRTLDLQFSFSNGTAIIPEETLDDEITYTSTVDIAKVVTRTVDYEGEWPVIGGISGDRATPRQLLALGEKIYGKPLTVDWLKMEDLDAGQLKTDNYPRLDMPSTPKDQVEEFSKMAAIGMLRSFHRGMWTVTDEWNRLLPDLEFSKVEDTLLRVWDKSSA